MSPKQEKILTHTFSVVTKENGSLPVYVYALKKRNRKQKQRKKYKEIESKTKKEIKKRVQQKLEN